jgi:hypothetical protein
VPPSSSPPPDTLLLFSIGARPAHTLLFSSTGVEVTLLGEATPRWRRSGPSLLYSSHGHQQPRSSSLAPSEKEAVTERVRSRWIWPGQGSSERASTT